MCLSCMEHWGHPAHALPVPTAAPLGNARKRALAEQSWAAARAGIGRISQGKGRMLCFLMSFCWVLSKHCIHSAEHPSKTGLLQVGPRILSAHPSPSQAVAQGTKQVPWDQAGTADQSRDSAVKPTTVSKIFG